jgi:hypothetical protein
LTIREKRDEEREKKILKVSKKYTDYFKELDILVKNRFLRGKGKCQLEVREV